MTSVPNHQPGIILYTGIIWERYHGCMMICNLSGLPQFCIFVIGMHWDERIYLLFSFATCKYLDLNSVRGYVSLCIPGGNSTKL